VFLFSSQGGQWPGMGASLYAAEPVFRKCIDACDREIAARLGWSLRDAMRNARSNLLVGDPYYIQPALTAVQMGLSQLLRSRGARPDAVAGLSMGEVAAACEAGALSLEEAMCVVCVQARLTRREQPPGRMAFAVLSPDIMRLRLAAAPRRVWLAVDLSPSLAVVSGEARDVERLLAELHRDAIHADYLPMAFAFHSPVVDVLEAEFRRELSTLHPRPPRLPIFSAVIRDQGRSSFGADHWWAIMRESASFTAMVKALLDRGASQIAEVGPEPILSDALREIIASTRSSASPSPTMRRAAAGAADLASVASALIAK
jgi:acyl transferase domain-containing protein